MASSRAQSDPNYPRFHVAPPVGRLNDPNGLVLKDGTYHVFYQFGPFFPDRKPIYWGHATSTDLVNWTTHDPALAPNDWYDRNGVYSGGATIDGDTVWLHYTGNVKNEDGTRGSYQSAATTRDFKTFEKVDANPLISTPVPGYTAHVRDPFVVPDGDGFTMYLGAQREDETGCVLVYSSPNLTDWKPEGESEVAPPPDGRSGYEDFGFMWECPNVLRLPDEETGEVFDVLIMSAQGIPAQEAQFRNIFACGYVVGHLDGTRFEPTSEFTELDNGFEFYGPQVFTTDEVGSAPLLMGWVGNASEDGQPSLKDFGWVHALTVPRELTLRGGRLHQEPKLGLDLEPLAIRGAELDEVGAAIAELEGVRSFVLSLAVRQRGDWHLVLGKAGGPHVSLEFAPGTLTVDRSSTHYPHGERRFVPVPDQEVLDVTVIHDRSVTEVFVGGGEVAFSMRSYLDPDGFNVAVAGDATVEQARYAAP